MIRIHLQLGRPLDRFHEKCAVQLNDTHPAIAVAELMRLLVDEHQMDWDTAWDVTRQTFAYTNHTLLPEALEKWPVGLFGQLLPRHLEIIYEINRRFLDEVRATFPGDDARLARMSLIDESGERYVRMAHLACVGSHHVNGVAATALRAAQARRCMRDFAELWPEKFTNVTNGVTPRRFVVRQQPAAGPAHHRAASATAGCATSTSCASSSRWPTTRTSSSDWREVKLATKRDLAALIAAAHRHRRRPGVAVRHPGQAPARIQAAAPQRAAHPHALPAPQARPAGRHAAAHLHLRRPRPRPATSWPSSSSS